MNLIIIGPPGGGKGTYSGRISDKYEIPHIATGDIFRREVDEGTELGQKISDYMDSGDLVPDDIVIEVMEKRLNESDCQDGFVLDGFPRTVAQAEALENITDIDLVVNLDVAEKVIINRLSGRRVCRDCGKIYHVEYIKPEEEGICDECGGELYQREDDKPDVIKNRIEEYEEKSEPLIKYYKDKNIVETVPIPEERPIEEIMKNVYEAVENSVST